MGRPSLASSPFIAEVSGRKYGCPVLVTPADVQPVLPTRVPIDWDGSQKAVHAFHGTIPCIEDSNTAVKIANLSEVNEREDLEPLRDDLRPHEVDVTGLVSLEATGSVASGLLGRMRPGEFDHLIMGPFGRPTWFEFLFGVTTAATMLRATVPVFTSY